MTIRQADLNDLDALAPLFDAYRQFYGQPPDQAMARSFLSARLAREESVVLLALSDDGRAAGFTQLYPTFCSVAAARLFVLHDLFVVPSHRRGGVATELLRAAVAFARERKATRLELSTAVTNRGAQALYEREGWRPVRDFQVYSLGLADGLPSE